VAATPLRARRTAAGLAACARQQRTSPTLFARAHARPSGVVLLSIGLFWLFRQCRNPKIRVKERWWLVEAVLGTSIFTMMLYNNPGFWYARCAHTQACALLCTAARMRACSALRACARR
jgi:hypothetical protein